MKKKGSCSYFLLNKFWAVLSIVRLSTEKAEMHEYWNTGSMTLQCVAWILFTQKCDITIKMKVFKKEGTKIKKTKLKGGSAGLRCPNNPHGH
jgi:hypothetical protein